MSAGIDAGDTGGDTPPPLSFPVILDDVFSPSGFMGEGEVENIVADLECPEGDWERGGHLSSLQLHAR